MVLMYPASIDSVSTLLEAGHIAQNICLVAIELGLGTCCIGAFDDKWLIKEFNLKGFPVYVVSIGKS